MIDQCASAACRGPLMADEGSRAHCGLCGLEYEMAPGQQAIDGPLRVELLRNALGQPEVIPRVIRIEFDETWANLRIKEGRAQDPYGVTLPIRWGDVAKIERIA